MSNSESVSLPVPLTSVGQQTAEVGWLDLHFQASRPEYEAMLRAVGIQPGWKVLDAGVGGGNFLPLLGDLVGQDGKICAIDLAPENIEAVQKRLKTTRFVCPVEVRQGSITDIPFADDTFDALWCANVLQYLHVEQIGSALAEFRRVVRPGGLVAVKEYDNTGTYFGPSDPILWWHLFEAIKGTDLELGAGALFTVDLLHHFMAAGFSDVRYQTFVGERQQPLRPVEIAFYKVVMPAYAAVAEQAGLPEAELELWRRKLKDVDGPEHLLQRPDFYLRESHGLAIGKVPG